MTGKKMSLALLVAGAGHHVAGWRLPEAEFGAENFDLIRRIVQTAERGRFDVVFFADAVNAGRDAHPKHIVRLEPLTLLGALCLCTSRIGLVATASTTYSEPYNIARAFASIDHMSHGRAGWNVVTGASPDAAVNFGTDPFPSHEARYGRAEEYVEVAKGLWDSWEDDALAGDKATGVYMDREKMHELNHSGAHFTVKGPLNITRPPQGYPVIFQAGASDRGLDFAARTAEVVFASQQVKEDAIAFTQGLRDRVEAAGRPRDAVKVLVGILPIIGRTEAEAQGIITRLADLADPVASMRVLSDRIGHDMSQFPLDEPVPELPDLTEKIQGHSVIIKAIAKRHDMTVRQLRDYVAASSGHRLVHGTAEQVADDMQDWFESGACDGFMVLPPYMPRPVEVFVDELIPILVRRGLFRAEYEGTTLRDHLGLPRPAHPAVARRAAAE